MSAPETLTTAAPAPVCFWTDLINATQVCGGTAPEPEPSGEVAFFAVEGGDGSGNGMFKIVYFYSDPEAQTGVCDEALRSALETAVDFDDVIIVGTAPAEVWLEDQRCGLEVPSDLGWTQAYLPMDRWPPPTGWSAQFTWRNEGQYDNYQSYWIKLSVKGVEYRGILYMGGGM